MIVLQRKSLGFTFYFNSFVLYQPGSKVNPICILASTNLNRYIIYNSLVYIEKKN